MFSLPLILLKPSALRLCLRNGLDLLAVTDQFKEQDRQSVGSISQKQEAVSIQTFRKVILPTFLILESHAEPSLLEEVTRGDSLCC
ncbi:hypothetical protein B9Z47_12640 [Limnohabitans sp. 2KL-1]|uniref:hypothetical protein n=1 Tax=Limnohabitans sp. 2KL-1 TaxID=1100699 RepID=UPI000D3374CD|nr:hypothetical protein [Limnohabitans sp. 2KL-1]PUE47136.1 hypothetical protein B9Z47_12640 [Limnohabitans sp. 2KL-1]